MKKINELVTKTEKPEHKYNRRAVTFGSFKCAKEKTIQERKDRHMAPPEGDLKRKLLRRYRENIAHLIRRKK